METESSEDMETETETTNNDKSINKLRKFFHINKEMIPAKLTYLLMDLAMGSLFPFISLFLLSIGLTVDRIGFISGVTSIFSFIAGPLWGTLADYTGRRRMILMILIFGTILVKFPLPWVAKAVMKTKDNITCSYNSTNATKLFDLNANNCVVRHQLLNPDVLFFVYLALHAISNIFFVGFLCYINGIIINVVTNSKSKASYGPQKTFGPIGFSLGSFISGYAIDHYKPKGSSPFVAAFYLFLAFFLLLLPVGHVLVGQSKWENKKKEEKSKVSITSHLKVILTKFDNIVFFLSCIVSGMMMSIYGGFAFLFMQDELHLTKMTMSYTVSICMVSEILVYIFSAKIVKYLGGNINCVILGIFSYFPRFLLISYANSAPFMLSIQLIHGVGISLTWTCFMQHANERFPKEIRMTVTTIMTSLHFILSGTVIGMVGGVIYKKFGGRALYRGASFIAATWACFMIFYFVVRNKIKKSPECSKAEKLQDIEMEEA